MGGVCKFFENFTITSYLWGWHMEVEGYTACKHGRGSSGALISNFARIVKIIKFEDLKV